MSWRPVFGSYEKNTNQIIGDAGQSFPNLTFFLFYEGDFFLQQQHTLWKGALRRLRKLLFARVGCLVSITGFLEATWELIKRAVHRLKRLMVFKWYPYNILSHVRGMCEHARVCVCVCVRLCFHAHVRSSSSNRVSKLSRFSSFSLISLLPVSHQELGLYEHHGLRLLRSLG